MLPPTIPRNDRLANRLIISVSVIVFLVVAALPKLHVKLDLPFDPHIFAAFNAVINSVVSVLLVAGLISVKQKNYLLHKRIMMSAIGLSGLFLVSYIAHHILAGETKFGGEGVIRIFYFSVLISHIILAAIILPFILFTAYRGLSGDYVKHKKITRYTFPLWLYVSVTGVLVYLLISPYYS